MGTDVATIDRTLADPELYREHIALIRYEGLSTLQGAERLRARMCAAAEVAKRAGAHEAEWMSAARESERLLGRMIIDARERGDLRPHGGKGPRTVGLPTLDDIGVPKALAAGAIALAKLTDEEWRSELDTRVREGRASFQGMTGWARVTLREREGRPARLTGRNLQAMVIDQLVKMAHRLDNMDAVSIPDTGMVHDAATDLQRALNEWVARVDAVSGVDSGR